MLDKCRNILEQKYGYDKIIEEYVVGGDFAIFVTSTSGDITTWRVYPNGNVFVE